MRGVMRLIGWTIDFVEKYGVKILLTLGIGWLICGVFYLFFIMYYTLKNEVR